MRRPTRMLTFPTALARSWMEPVTPCMISKGRVTRWNNTPYTKSLVSDNWRQVVGLPERRQESGAPVSVTESVDPAEGLGAETVSW